MLMLHSQHGLVIIFIAIIRRIAKLVACNAIVYNRKHHLFQLLGRLKKNRCKLPV